MVALNSMLLAGSILSCVSALPNLDKRQTPLDNYIGEGIGEDKFFYTVWENGHMNQTFTNKLGGAFDMTWEDENGQGDVVSGKGWKLGTGRTISYTADYKPNGNSFLMIYGWFKNPLVEYYVMENWDPKSHPGKDIDNEYVTTFNTDGSDYDVYKKYHVGWPSILGQNTNFDQYRSVRKTPRSSGSVNMAAHFAAWRGAGLTLNTPHYQVVAVEGMREGTKGSASITVSEGNSNVQPAVPAPAPPASSPPVVRPSSSSTRLAPSPVPGTTSFRPVPEPSPEPESTQQEPAPTVQPTETVREPSPEPNTPLPSVPITTPAPVPSLPAYPAPAPSSTRTRRTWWANRKGRKGQKSGVAAAAKPTKAVVDSVQGQAEDKDQANVAVKTIVHWVTEYAIVTATRS